MTKKLISHSEEETENLGAILAKHLAPGDILAFEGDLGAGKTCLIRGIAKELGVKNNITSSSFVLMRPLIGKYTIYHFDLYRLSNQEELADLGYEEFMFSDGISLVEWAEKMGELIGKEFLLIKIEYDDIEPEKRHVMLMPAGERANTITEKFTSEYEIKK